MTPNQIVELKRLNRRLSIESRSLYWTLIERACTAHQDHPYVPSLFLLVKERDVLGMLGWTESFCSPQLYASAVQYHTAIQFAAMIRKYPFDPQDVLLDPEGEAYKKFLRSEHKCRRVNQRFRAYRKRSPYESLLSKSRSFIRYVLGDSPSLDSIYSNCGFGPGAAIGVHGDATSLARKFLSDLWSVTPGAQYYARSALFTNPHFRTLLSDERGHVYCADPDLWKNTFRERSTMVHYNKIVFVPKTAVVHRTIAIEPLLNGFVQKGIDVVMRCRLQRTGIDLSDQSLNQRMARDGSFPGQEDPFVTIDLASASDSIAREVVKNLLPPEWFELLNSTRSSSGMVFDREMRYEKFCSMGNGFCFPLETLLFASACHASGCGRPGIDFSVYGDDIIVRSSKAETVLELLSVLGFSVNKKKTFLTGSFRESCGADWFGGEDVRPFTLDFRLDSLQAFFKLSNLTHRSPLVTAFFDGIREEIFSRIPPRWRFVRPYPGNDDSAATVELDQFMSSTYSRWNSNLQCWSWLELVSSGVPDSGLRGHRQYHQVLVMAALTGSSSSAPFTFRRKSKTKVRRISHSAATSTWLPSKA